MTHGIMQTKRFIVFLSPNTLNASDVKGVCHMCASVGWRLLYRSGGIQGVSSKTHPAQALYTISAAVLLNDLVDSKWANSRGEQWHHMWVANLARWCQANRNFTGILVLTTTLPFLKRKFQHIFWTDIRNERMQSQKSDTQFKMCL